MVSVLTIAGSDPSGGAGIEADLRVFAQMGVHGRTAITALTVQSLAGGLSVHPTSASVLSEILHSHDHDPSSDAIKIGMIGTLANLEVVCNFLQCHPQIPVVLDPVLRATSGLELLESAAISALMERLWPRALVVTPNLDETGILLGHRPTTIAEMESAARELQRGNQVVVVKGGHLVGDPVDVIWDGRKMQHLSSPRIDTPHLRGTGCRLSSAVAAGIALKNDLMVAISNAKFVVTHFLQSA